MVILLLIAQSARLELVSVYLNCVHTSASVLAYCTASSHRRAKILWNSLESLKYLISFFIFFNSIYENKIFTCAEENKLFCSCLDHLHFSSELERSALLWRYHNEQNIGWWTQVVISAQYCGNSASRAWALEDDWLCIPIRLITHNLTCCCSYKLWLIHLYIIYMGGCVFMDHMYADIHTNRILFSVC